MDAQAKRILVSIMLAIDLIVALYVALMGNWGLGIEIGYLADLDERFFGLLPILMAAMWIKVFADLYLLYFISRSFQESIGMLDKAVADANWFIVPGIKVSIATILLQLVLVILDPFDHDAFADEKSKIFGFEVPKIDFGDFLATGRSFLGFDLLLFITLAEIFLLVTLIGLFFFTKDEK
ncbi:MAG: hypothetical protein ACXACI_03625 [Candidatus Hodarchaeales archaeon]